MQKRILIFAAGGLGDILQTTPMIRAIKLTYPDSHIILLVVGNSQKILLKGNKYVNLIINIYSKEYNSLIGSLRLIRQLRKNNIEYCFFNHAVQRPFFYVIPFLSGIKKRIGHDKSTSAKNPGYKIFAKLITHPLAYNVAEKHKTSLNLELLNMINIKYSDRSYDLKLIESSNIQPKLKKIVGIHAGSNAKAKIRRWSAKQFNELAIKIRDELNFDVRFYIGPDDNDIMKFLNKNFSFVTNKSLEFVIKDISNCDYFISNDSGLSHIAAAAKVPTMVIYGPTLSRDITLPTKYIAVEIDELSCRPCWHLRQPCKIGHICLEDLTVEKVFAKFVQLIS